MLIEESFYEQYAVVCKTIVNPVRLQIISIIGDKKLNVSEIQSNLNNISMSNLSNHLNALHRVGVLTRAKKGSFIYYYLTEKSILTALEHMRDAIKAISARRSRMMMEAEPISGETDGEN